MEVAFRRVTPADFPLLSTWLADPDVHRWWNHDPSPAAVERDFGPATRGEEPGEDHLVLLDGRAEGLVQWCRLEDYPEDHGPLADQVEVPPGAVSVDYLLGSARARGRGIGPVVIRAAVRAVLDRYPDAPAALVPVAAGNRRSWRALEKAGFRRVGEVLLTPDDPTDGPEHVVYRLDRHEIAAPASRNDDPARLPGVLPFDDVVSLHGALVLRVCRAVLGPVDAEDAWSETFLAALRAYPRLDPSTNLEAWLVTVAHRKAVDVLRRRAREAVPTDAPPDRAVVDPERHDDLYAALAMLPERQRLCVAHHHLAGLPHRAVGALVGVSEEAARRASADGVRSLRRALAVTTGEPR